MRRLGFVLLLNTMLMLGALPALAADRHWSPTELAVLNGIGGFGDVGKLDTAPDVLAPGNTLGFSLKVDWEDHPADPPYWSIRTGLPGGFKAADYDTLAFDLRVESNTGASVSLFLVEPDDNRWVAWGSALKELPTGQWRHVETQRDAMRQWRLSQNAFDWNAIKSLAIETGGGKAVFYLDNLVLKGPGGRVLQILDTTDDGLHADPAWHQPVAPLPPVGTVFLPHDASRIEDATMRASAIELGRRLGQVGVPLSGYGQSIVDTMAALRQGGVSSIYYASMGGAYRRFLTKRGGWDVNQAGRSLNWLPGALTDWDWQHMLALAHPAVTEAQHLRADALLQAGIGTWMVVDYVFPWQDGPWGYSEAMRDAFRADLLGTEEGLYLRRDGKDVVTHFADYCRAYLGFVPQPAQLGYGRWADWQAPEREIPPAFVRARWQVFLLLRSYEWLKLPDRSGRYYRDHGGNPLWIIPNPEDTNASSDYLYLVQSAGVGNVFPEWFGPIGWAAEASYASLPGLREAADRAGHRLSLIHETGAGGHSAAYLDWRVAYAGIYALTASGRLDNFDNDFLDEGPVSVMDHRETDKYQFTRFRDGFAKALAFRQARADHAVRPTAPILCLTERPPAKACGSPYFGLNQPHSLATGLSRAHLLFDTRDATALPEALDRYRLVAYSPFAPRPGDLASLRAWLTAQPGRVLVTHSYMPTRSTEEFWGTDRSAGLGSRNDGGLLGLGAITAGTARHIATVEAPAAWKVRSRAVDFEAPLCATGGVQTVVRSDAGPLVSRAKVGQGTVYYLHYAAGDGDGAQRLDADVLRAIASEQGLQPFVEADFDTLVQSWDVPGGRVIEAWDAPAMGRWTWKYEPGIAPLPYVSPGVRRTIRVPSAGAGQVYDFCRGELTASGAAPVLELKDSLCGLWYLAADQPSLAPAIALRQRLAQWQDPTG